MHEETRSALKLLEIIEIQESRAEQLPPWVRDSSEMQTLSYFGLCDLPQDGPPMLTKAGQQYIEREGQVGLGVLQYLPRYMPNLKSREAMIEASSRLLQQYGQAIAEGKGEKYTQNILPPAFRPAVSPGLSARMYAAAAASITRLSDQEPAGCVAEEVVAARIMQQAAELIEQEVTQGVSEAQEAEEAIEGLGGIFSLFQDSQVLELFEMAEPADAALSAAQTEKAGSDQADQRLEAWFRPLWGKAAGGHLGEYSEWEPGPNRHPGG